MIPGEWFCVQHIIMIENKIIIMICIFRAEEIMTLKSDRHPCVTLALIASMPRVFEAVQDKCITKANCKKDSKQFYVGKKKKRKKKCL